MHSLVRKSGTRRAAVRFVAHAALARVGAYRSYLRVDWSQVRRLVFICSGNICRSPFAAELARIRGFEVASFGVDACGGAVANEAAQRVAARWKVDMTTHISTSRHAFVLQSGDLLVAMEPAHLIALEGCALPEKTQLTLLGLWSAARAPYLPDPYGRKDECFEFVFGLIDGALHAIESLMRGARCAASMENA